MNPPSLTKKGQKEAIRLYQSGLSAKQTADTLGVSIGAVYYPLRRYKIQRRSAVESNRIRFEATPLSYSIKTQLSESEKELKLAGTMLYWAEGYKIGQSIDFANSDPAMASIFIKFLRTVCGVGEERIRCKLYCYEGQDVEKLLIFWSQLLLVPVNQFTRPFVTKSAPGPRGPRMIHGLIHICYSDKRLLREILLWINEYSKNLTRRW